MPIVLLASTASIQPPRRSEQHYDEQCDSAALDRTPSNNPRRSRRRRGASTSSVARRYHDLADGGSFSGQQGFIGLEFSGLEQ